MHIFVEFDCYADIIDVPQFIGDDIELYRRRFLKWLYDRRNKHQYWVKASDGNGGWFYGVQYGFDAFEDRKGPGSFGFRGSACFVPRFDPFDYMIRNFLGSS